MELQIALIAAIPATIAAFAAWLNAAKTHKKVVTSNGHTVGQLAEATYELTKSVARRQDEMVKSLENHIQDQVAHRREGTIVAELVQNKRQAIGGK